MNFNWPRSWLFTHNNCNKMKEICGEKNCNIFDNFWMFLNFFFGLKWRYCCLKTSLSTRRKKKKSRKRLSSFFCRKISFSLPYFLSDVDEVVAFLCVSLCVYVRATRVFHVHYACLFRELLFGPVLLCCLIFFHFCRFIFVTYTNTSSLLRRCWRHTSKRCKRLRVQTHLAVSHPYGSWEQRRVKHMRRRRHDN